MSISKILLLREGKSASLRRLFAPVSWGSERNGDITSIIVMHNLAV
jgi:hypothetical protein